MRWRRSRLEARCLRKNRSWRKSEECNHGRQPASASSIHFPQQSNHCSLFAMQDWSEYFHFGPTIQIAGGWT